LRALTALEFDGGSELCGEQQGHLIFWDDPDQG
jgi:hypothetical protein